MSNVVERFFDTVLAKIGALKETPDAPLERPVDYPEDLVDCDELWAQIGRDAVCERVDPGQARGNQRTLDNDERRAIDGGLRTGGLDLWAFYKSYRHRDAAPFPGNWGVFYLETALARLSELLHDDLPSLMDPDGIAVALLWRHEYYHFKFDVATLAFEGIGPRAFYAGQKRAFRKCRSHQPEEALANRDVLEWVQREDPSLRSPPRTGALNGLERFARDLMNVQPGAYARYDEPKPQLQREAAAGLFEGLRYKGATSQGIDYGPWIGTVPWELRRHELLPEYVVRKVCLSDVLDPARWVPLVTVIQESKEVAQQLANRYRSLLNQWSATKQKLINAPSALGLDFKPWKPTPDQWSVRVNDNFRAHLRPLNAANGVWEAVKFGPHTAMGHG